MSQLKLSHSAISKYEDCPKQYEYHYVERLSPDVTSANLVFGGAVDVAIKDYVTAQFEGREIDPAPIFLEAFQERAAEGPVAYGARLKKDDMLVVGQKMVTKFVTTWNRLGYQPVAAQDGKPMLELDIEARMPDGTILRSILDCVALSPEGETHVLDFKAAAATSAEVVTLLNDQLTSQQMVLQANGDRLGIGPVDKIGFFEMVKNKDPRVEEPYLVPARTAQALKDYQQKVLWVAEDIRRGRFPKRPRNAYNTPCAMCDFAALCTRGSRSGLKQRPARSFNATPKAA